MAKPSRICQYRGRFHETINSLPAPGPHINPPGLPDLRHSVCQIVKRDTLYVYQSRLNKTATISANDTCKKGSAKQRCITEKNATNNHGIHNGASYCISDDLDKGNMDMNDRKARQTFWLTMPAGPPSLSDCEMPGAPC